MRNKIMFYLLAFVALSSFLSLGVSAASPTVCCEKTTSGLYCQDVPVGECSTNSRQVPTSCSSTSFCNPGVCFNSNEGTCATNTPQVVCNANNGVWTTGSPPQCQLGCCLLGDQAAFVTLTRCKKLSSQLGLTTNYDKSITDETQCILSVKGSEDGACVYTSDFETTCKRTTRAGCSSGNSSAIAGRFYPGKLCSAEELGTNCGPTTKTTCLPGKDGVYFVDTCGNPANIYDSSKLSDKEYWGNIKDVSASCNSGRDNSLSTSCGNCNYLLGSFCRASSVSGKQANYGNYICADLNCERTSNGKSYKHGESWCVYTDSGKLDEGANAVGSRFYRHLCVNGEELVEQCADFRQETCIQDEIKTIQGVTFSQAGCRVNRWQDCTAQSDKADCENTDRRDCLWKPGLNFGNSTDNVGVCVPQNSPGIKFWEGEDAKQICAQANVQCIVKFEKKLLGGGMECKENCECLTREWELKHTAVCTALGDCGPKINWVGSSGYKAGTNLTIKSV